MMRPAAMLALAVCLGGCSVYMPEREWSLGIPTDRYRSKQAQEAFIEDRHAHFPAELRDCIASQDPSHLDDIDAGKKYRLSGWFIDRQATSRVIRCMQGKGWSISGAAI
jgi:hypothetical protein